MTVSGKYLWDCLSLQLELATFFMEHHFYLKEQLDRQIMAIQYLADVFTK